MNYKKNINNQTINHLLLVPGTHTHYPFPQAINDSVKKWPILQHQLTIQRSVALSRHCVGLCVCLTICFFLLGCVCGCECTIEGMNNELPNDY